MVVEVVLAELGSGSCVSTGWSSASNTAMKDLCGAEYASQAANLVVLPECMKNTSEQHPFQCNKRFKLSLQKHWWPVVAATDT